MNAVVAENFSRYSSAMRFILVLSCAVALWHGGAARAAGLAAREIPKEWLSERLSVAEAEAAFPGITDDRAKAHPEIAKPFGFLSGEWDALKNEMQPGDEIWRFSSPGKDWEDLAGRGGVALVRNGVPIKVIVTVMN